MTLNASYVEESFQVGGKCMRPAAQRKGAPGNVWEEVRRIDILEGTRRRRRVVWWYVEFRVAEASFMFLRFSIVWKKCVWKRNYVLHQKDIYKRVYKRLYRRVYKHVYISFS